MNADASDLRLESRDIPHERPRTLRDLMPESASRQRGRQAALRFELLDEGPCFVAKRLGQRIECSGPRGWIGDKAEMGFAQQNELSVASEASREAVRKTDNKRMR